MKVVTTAAAMKLLGDQGQFETRFEVGGNVRDGLLDGDLIVRGGGDPVVRDGSRGQVEGFFGPLVDALRSAGIRRIGGEVVLDEGDFLEPGTGPSWPSANQHWKDYCAFAAGLTLNGGVLETRVTPGRVGGAAGVELHPRPTGLPERIGVTTKAGQLNDVRVGATATRVTVGGAIGAKTLPVEAEFRHPDPVGLFGAVLEARLASAGIAIDGGIVRRRGPPAGRVLLVISSPIVDSLVPINTYSTNGVADQLFFKLGHDFGGAGSRAGGEAAVRRALEELGISADGLHQLDGSGLSRDDRVAPAQLTALLFAALEGLDDGRPAARLFQQSLAVMGETGTLEKRMRMSPAAGHVFAKTGYLDGTSSLSGLVSAASGRPLVFSILVNYPSIGGLNTRAWKPMQEAMVERLFRGELP
jgi:D-alanyl-D-alanine carboxypeptidase/D-alanyl-D-alanine-endopeptidase (penicillin-binding protein 4)